MSLIKLTVQPVANVSHFSAAVTLDGARYRIELYTNTLNNRWYLDIANDDETSIVRSVMLAAGSDLLAQFRHLDMPPGWLFVHTVHGGDPEIDDFIEQRASLYYLEAVT